MKNCTFLAALAFLAISINVQAERKKLDIPAIDCSRLDGAPRELRQSRARDILKEQLVQGHILVAVHILTFLGAGIDESFRPAIRERWRRLGSSPLDNHLRMSLIHARLRLGDETVLPEILSGVKSENEIELARFYYMLIESAPPRHDNPVVRSISHEIFLNLQTGHNDRALDAAAIGALIQFDPHSRLSLSQNLALRENLFRISSEEGRGGIRGKLEIDRLASDNTLKLGEGFKNAPTFAALREELLAGGSSEEELVRSATRGKHDEVMFALEAMAKRPTDRVRALMARFQEMTDWEGRLRFAYYLRHSGDSEQAFARLSKEKNPLVQAALLSALARSES